MEKKQILGLSVAELSEYLASRELSAVEVTDVFLRHLREKEEEIGAFLTVCGEQATDAAAAIDKRRADGEMLPPLAGVPMALKDNLCTKGILTTCASQMLRGFVPPYDAAVWEKLQAQGTVLLGKLNMDEFAMGSSNENSSFHPTRNPRDPSRVPGGSSGGSAAAVAAKEVPFALGSDTGGSIRQPASFCGVVGMKPTYGRVSRYGLVAFASSLDQIGPLTSDVRDNAIVLGAIAGKDPRDATCVSLPVPDYTAELEKGVEGLVVGVLKQFFGEGLAPAVKDAVERAAKTLEGLGAKLKELSLSAVDHALPAYYVLSSAEASSNLSRFDGVRYGYRAESYDDITDLYCASRSEGFGSEVKRRIMIGTFALSAGYYDAYYKKALQVRTLIRRELEQALETCDVILSPVSPTTAYRLGEKIADPLQMYLGDVYTVPANIAGLPALSLPCDEDGDGLPIGMQLLGRAFDESTLYRVGYAFEQTGKERK